ncbi:MAG: cytosolic protein [Bacilli bacterium]
MKFKDYFSNTFETSEHHYIPSLRSRYYSCRNEQAVEAVRAIARKLNAFVKYVDHERHEIIFEAKNYLGTATLVSVSYTVTAVDFMVITQSLLPLGKGKKIIEEYYRELDNVIPFKDIGLYH